MRLSEERVHFIAEQIAEQLLKKRLIATSLPKHSIIRIISRTIIEDLKVEDEINEEAREMISHMKREIPEGSSEWESTYTRLKEEIAKRRNYLI